MSSEDIIFLGQDESWKKERKKNSGQRNKAKNDPFKTGSEKKEQKKSAHSVGAIYSPLILIQTIRV